MDRSVRNTWRSIEDMIWGRFTSDFNPNHDELGRFASGSEEWDPLAALMAASEEPDSEYHAPVFGASEQERIAPKSKLSEAALATCRRIEDQTVGRSDELMSIVDKDGNIVTQVEGAGESVMFNPGLIHKMDGRIVTHNHPAGGTFSQEDLSVFSGGMSSPRAIRAVCEEGTYHLERGDATHSQVFNFNKKASSACQTAMMEIADVNKNISRDVASGRLSASEGEVRKADLRSDILKNLNREYERLADEHGLIYYYERN